MAKKMALFALVATVYLLHQDFWNWQRYEPLVGNFVPIGLAYHVGYSLVAAVTMAVLVRCAWPGDLEDDELTVDQESRH